MTVAFGNNFATRFCRARSPSVTTTCFFCRVRDPRNAPRQERRNAPTWGCELASFRVGSRQRLRMLTSGRKDEGAGRSLARGAGAGNALKGSTTACCSRREVLTSSLSASERCFSGYVVGYAYDMN